MLSRKGILKGLKWFGIIFAALFVVGVIARIPHVLEAKKTAEAVAEIHATKLTLADVMGDNLPSDPGTEADKTIAGIDANKNGIRDDVELAIFKEYPDSAKTRAALLQYAMALQMQFTQSLATEGVVVAVAQERSRASLCIADVTPRSDIENFLKKTKYHTDFVRTNQLNTKERNLAESSFLSRLASYSDLAINECDVDLNGLEN